jgi:PST family polysaccharide transporter
VKRNFGLKNVKSTGTKSISSDEIFLFDTPKENRDLKSLSIKSGTITLIAQFIKLILQIVSITVLARLLTPQDFGLIAMVSAIFAFAQIFGDMGLSTATIQRAEISHAQVSNLFWVNSLLGVGLMFGCMALSPLLSWFYGESKVTWVAIVLSTNFMLGGLRVQHQAILTRQMRFGWIATVEISSSFLGILTAIALSSYGYWALVAMPIVTNIMATLETWIICRWFPGLPSRGSGVRTMITFGGNLTIMSLLNYFARNLDNVLIGRFWGPVQLGFYSRAYNLFMMPMTQITYPIANVAMPVLSKLQNDGERFKKYYLSAVSVIAFITMPLSVFLFIMADEIVIILLGQQWLESITIFRFLAISLFFQPICSSGNWLYVAIGRSDLLLKYGSLGSLCTVLSFFIGLPFGPAGIALSYSISFLLWTGPSLYFATRNAPVSMVNIIKKVKPLFVGAFLGGIFLEALKLWTKIYLPMWALLLVGFILTTIIYVLVVFYIFRQKNFYLSILRNLGVAKGG